MKRRGPGQIRIAAGRWKGRGLEVPEAARPTSGRARESLFDLLGARVEGARFLDLHSGSGAVGIEAVSRGSTRAVLAERESTVLARNVARLGSPPELSVLACEAGEAVERLSAAGERFDVIFSDPPYGERTAPPPGIERLVAAGGLVVLQRDADAPSPEVPGLVHFRERAYGRNVFDFYTPAPADGETSPETP